jgi:hypothetical protein
MDYPKLSPFGAIAIFVTIGTGLADPKPPGSMQLPPTIRRPTRCIDPNKFNRQNGHFRNGCSKIWDDS